MQTPSWKGYDIQESKQEVTKVLRKKAEKHRGVHIYLNPTALSTAKTLPSFGCTECNMVKTVVFLHMHLYHSLNPSLTPNTRAMMALGRSPEYHWNQVTSKTVHWFCRRSRLKLFSIYSPCGHFVQQSGSGQFL